MQVKFRAMRGGIKPKRATQLAAGYDLYLPADVQIKKGRQLIPLGFAIELPEGYEADIEPRSGFSSKGMLASDGNRKDADVIEGKVDADYRGEVHIILNNHGEPFELACGTRIAQMTIRKHEVVEFVESEELSETERGEGGFGHSGAV